MVGNHEMWTRGRKATAKRSGSEGEPEGISSVDKLVQLHRMCEVGGHPAIPCCVRVAVFFVSLHPTGDLRGRSSGMPLQFRATRRLVVHCREGVCPSYMHDVGL